MVSDAVFLTMASRRSWVLILVLMEYGLWHRFWEDRHQDDFRLNPCSNGIWSLTMRSAPGSQPSESVLILVLMEYGLWPMTHAHKLRESTVLILVLMEYGLWLWHSTMIKGFISVLILVLMEYGLWLSWRDLYVRLFLGLNPCSNGIWSLTMLRMILSKPLSGCLNPCSNGIWSLTVWSQ